MQIQVVKLSASEEVMPLDIRLFPCPVQEGVGWRKDRGFGGQRGKVIWQFAL